MQSLTGKHQQIIISHDLMQPRGLAIDPIKGFIYFSDWHESMSRIERAYLDGSHRSILVCFFFLFLLLCIIYSVYFMKISKIKISS